MHIELHAKYFVHAHYQSKLKKKKKTLSKQFINAKKY